MSVVCASSMAGLAMLFSVNGFTPIAPFLLPRHLVGSALSLQGAANVIVMPFVGPAVDAFGSHSMLWVGLGMQAIANLLTSVSTDLMCQMFGRAVQGCAGGMVFASQVAFVMDNFKEPLRSQHVGTVLGSTILGGMLGPPIVSSAYAASADLEMRQAWTFLPAFFLLALAVFALMRVPVQRQQSLLETQKEEERMASSTSNRCSAFRFLVVYARIGFQGALISVQLCLVFFANAALQCASTLLLHSKGYSPLALGMIFVPCTMVQAIVNPLAGRLAGDPVRRRQLFMCSLFMLAAGLLITGCLGDEASPVAATAVAMLVSSTAVAMSDAPSISFMSELAAAKGIGNGEAITASEIAVCSGQAIGPCVGQFCLCYFGFDGLCLGISAIAGALAVLASIWLEVGGHASKSNTDISEA